MSEPTAKQIADEGLLMLAEMQEQQKLLQGGLPSPQNAMPIKFYGVTFYPHPDDDCWRLYPASPPDKGQTE